MHLNPARAGLVGAKEALADFPWSSLPSYLGAPRRRPAWLRVDRLLGEWGVPKDSPAGRRVFGAGMEARRRQDSAKESKAVERGWCLGSETFRRELLEQVRIGPGPSHFGAAVQEGAQVRAEGLVAAGLKRLGWREGELDRRRKGDAGKVALAMKLRAQTTMPLAWIAQRLRMGSRGYLTWLLQRRRGCANPEYDNTIN